MSRKEFNPTSGTHAVCLYNSKEELINTITLDVASDATEDDIWFEGYQLFTEERYARYMHIMGDDYGYFRTFSEPAKLGNYYLNRPVTLYIAY